MAVDCCTLLAGFQSGGFIGLLAVLKQSGIQVTRRGFDFRTARCRRGHRHSCPRFHGIEFLLNDLGVLLDLLGLAESFGELTEIGDWNPAIVILNKSAG